MRCQSIGTTLALLSCFVLGCKVPRPRLDYAWDYYERGNRELHAGRYENARADLQEAIKMEPDTDVYHLDLGCVLGYQHQYGKARVEMLKALSLNPRYGLGYVNLAWVESKEKNFLAAEEAALKATSIRPDDSIAWDELGWPQLQIGSLADAAHSFHKAIEVDSHDFYAHNNYGVALYRLGRVREASDQWEYVSLHGSSTTRGIAKMRLEDPNKVTPGE